MISLLWPKAQATKETNIGDWNHQNETYPSKDIIRKVRQLWHLLEAVGELWHPGGTEEPLINGVGCCGSSESEQKWSLAVVSFPERQLGEERFTQTWRDTLTSTVSVWDGKDPPESRGMHLVFPSPHPHSTSGSLLRLRAWSSALWHWRHCGVLRPHPCLILPWLSSIHLSPTSTAQRLFFWGGGYYPIVVLFYLQWLFHLYAYFF